MAKRTDSWLELLRLRPFSQTTPLPERAKFQHVLIALSLHVPLRYSQTWAPQRAAGDIQKIRRRIASNEIFAHHAFGKTMGVAHREWSPAALRAFGLEEPPSPYEVACFTLGQDAAQSRRFFQGMSTRMPKVYTSAFQWWLMGVGDEAITAILPDWDYQRGRYIEALMQQAGFAMWALGTDLTPVVRSPIQARALLTEETRYRKVRRALYETTYVQTLLKLGKRPRPVERRLPSIVPLFSTWAEKADFLETLSSSQEHHRTLEKGNIWWYMVGVKKYKSRTERKLVTIQDPEFESEGRAAG